MYHNETDYYATLDRWTAEMNRQGEWILPQLQHSAYIETAKQWQQEVAQLRDDISSMLERGEKEDHYQELTKKRAIPILAEKLHQTWLFLDNVSKQQQFNRATNDVVIANPVPIGGHRLPELPYAYDALEPYIEEEIMRLHHDKHHQSYVDGLNQAELKMAEARQTGDFDLIRHWEREAAFHGAGHYLHTIFWNVMSPEGGGRPDGELLTQIEQDFGSYDAFQKHFSEAAKEVEGAGWAILIWSPRSHRLEILQAEQHQNLSQWDAIPLLVLDVWEHAYYLQYKNDRAEYVDNWWNIVNWDHVNQRYQAAKNLLWQPY